MKKIIVIDLAFRKSGFVILNPNGEVICKKTITIESEYDLENTFKECCQIIEKQLKEIKSMVKVNKGVEYEVVVEFTKSNKIFPIMLGLFCTKLQFMFNVSRFYFVSPTKWQRSLLKSKGNAKSKELKALAKEYASRFVDLEDWTQDEIDAFCVGKYWIEQGENNETKK